MHKIETFRAVLETNVSTSSGGNCEKLSTSTSLSIKKEKARDIAISSHNKMPQINFS